MNAEDIYKLIETEPYKIAHAVGFDKLTSDINNNWIKTMLFTKEDATLQAHRGSYKTTCVSVGIALLMIIKPDIKILFIRKTDTDVKEIVKQVKNILLSDIMQEIVYTIYGECLKLIVDNSTSISTNLKNDTKGTEQLTALGIGTSITGKHFDLIFTDDIVNISDRQSKAERERTKLFYQELQNIKNRDGVIINTGTPWHKEDAFSIMPKPVKYDCYSTGLMTTEEIKEKKDNLSPSLFAANYELRHIASEDIIFEELTEVIDDVSVIENAWCHVDAAFDGEDFTAFSAMKKKEGKYYLYGKMWRKHVDDVKPLIENDIDRLLLGRMFTENNADKGYVAKEFKKDGYRVVTYHEDMNKYVKIATYLKRIWKDVIIVAGTDEEYLQQIYEYNENAEHDDAPDSASCLARRFLYKQDKSGNENINGMFT